MHNRAQQIAFWPGITQDIEAIRANCQSCNRNSPSQPSLPQEASDPPTNPFEKIFADVFQFAGNNFLVVGDRLSGWLEIFSIPRGTSQAGSRGLIKCLRVLFSRFGVPEEISSDGGPEFTSSATKEFLKPGMLRIEYLQLTIQDETVEQK